MKKIYILLMHTNTIPANLIRFFTRYRYSHVAISFNKECNILYSFGRRKPHSIINAGFTKEYKNGEFFKYFNKTECKIYELEITEEQYEKFNAIIENMKLNEEKYKYDILGIFPRYFGIPVTRENKFVCSYFAAHALEKANICKFNKEACLVKPQDFEEINSLKEIYKGYYNLYA